MAYPRATFPPSILSEYASGVGLKTLAAQYGSGHCTIRRWISERMPIRRHGTKK